MPTSKHIGKTLLGLKPAPATYRSNFPIEIYSPPIPRSPKPKTLLPSVTTIASTSFSGQL